MNHVSKLHDEPGAPIAMVVDEWYVLRDLFMEMLFRLGFDVYAAPSVEAARTLAVRVQPQVVLADYDLGQSKENGAALVRECGAEVVIGTSNRHPNAPEAFASAGAAYLPKPFTMAQFREILCVSFNKTETRLAL